VKGSTWSLPSAVSRVEINWEPICQDLYGVLESRKYAAHACGTGHNWVSCKVFISVIAIGFMKLPAPAEVKYAIISAFVGAATSLSSKAYDKIQ
jgi:hypothetical protein